MGPCHPVGQLHHVRQPFEVTSSLEAASLSGAAPSCVEDLSCGASFLVRQLDDVSQPIQMRKPNHGLASCPDAASSFDSNLSSCMWDLFEESSSSLPGWVENTAQLC